MRAYLDLCRLVLDHGTDKPTRAVLPSTGERVSARSVFGAQARFDLRQGFPAVTVKRLPFKGVVAELLWFLSGSTNVRPLQAQGVTIWDEWADPKTGELGPIYGWAWRRWGARPEWIKQPKPNLREGLHRRVLGIANGSGAFGHPLRKTWEGLMLRCYAPTSIGYEDYGGKGVHVCDRWLEFSAFAEDAIKLPGWHLKATNMRGYVLDKDGLGDGFCYAPDTCQWVTPSENGRLKSRRIYTVRRIADGAEFSFANPQAFCLAAGVDDRNFSDLWTGRKGARVREGFELVSVRDLGRGTDQLVELVDGIRATRDNPEHPRGRRLLVNLWSPQYAAYAALPPCHYSYQASVAHGHLSAHVVMRSCDAFLGLPWNIASYALLTHMLAQVCSLEVGELTMSFGDIHIYANHFDQVREALRREPRSPPRLSINPRRRDIAEFVPSDFSLDAYDHHPELPGEVAV